MHEARQHKFEAIRTLPESVEACALIEPIVVTEKSRSLSRSDRNLGLCLKNSGQNQVLGHGEI
jgi:hypothetical protein